MDRNQVTLLMAKAVAAYPNKAPDFKRNPQTFEIWVERLKVIDAQLALSNLDTHIDSSNFFPDISDIVQAKRNIAIHEQSKLNAAMHFLQLDTWSTNNEPPPDRYWDSVRDRMVGDPD